MTEFKVGERVRITMNFGLGEQIILVSQLNASVWVAEREDGLRETWPIYWFERISAVEQLAGLADD